MQPPLVFSKRPVFFEIADMCNFAKSLAAAGEDMTSGCVSKEILKAHPKKGIPDTTLLPACHQRKNVRS